MATQEKLVLAEIFKRLGTGLRQISAQQRQERLIGEERQFKTEAERTDFERAKALRGMDDFFERRRQEAVEEFRQKGRIDLQQLRGGQQVQREEEAARETQVLEEKRQSGRVELQTLRGKQQREALTTRAQQQSERDKAKSEAERQAAAKPKTRAELFDAYTKLSQTQSENYKDFQAFLDAYKEATGLDPDKSEELPLDITGGLFPGQDKQVAPTTGNAGIDFYNQFATTTPGPLGQPTPADLQPAVPTALSTRGTPVIPTGEQPIDITTLVDPGSLLDVTESESAAYADSLLDRFASGADLSDEENEWLDRYYLMLLKSGAFNFEAGNGDQR